MTQRTDNLYPDSVFRQLNGIQYGYVFADADSARRAVQHLMTCDAHKGAHHFIVTDEGKGVAVSRTGASCLKKVNLV